MKKQMISWGMASLLTLSGCAGQYVLPEGSPQATLHIVTKHPFPWISGWRYYSDSECTDSSSVILGAFSGLYEGEKRVQIRAGTKGYLVVRVRTIGPTVVLPSGSITTKTGEYCGVQFEISPVPGRTYRAEQKHSELGHNCGVTIINEDTGAISIDAKPIAIPINCRLK
ncbi:MAG: hypothetical protein H6R18_318 [Proteobacteria bacterium]|nr:hypothetical protein [Pseudomonadota bacterium]